MKHGSTFARGSPGSLWLMRDDDDWRNLAALVALLVFLILMDWGRR